MQAAFGPAPTPGAALWGSAAAQFGAAPSAGGAKGRTGERGGSKAGGGVWNQTVPALPLGAPRRHVTSLLPIVRGRAPFRKSF